MSREHSSAASDLQLSRDQVLAFRLRAHGLDRRQPVSELLSAAGACGVQNSPPTSALQGLAARIDGLGPELFDELIADKTLLQTWSMRGAPFIFPTVDAAVFTTGVLPPTEPGRTQLIVGVEPALRRVGIGLDELVKLLGEELAEVLAGRQLAINELGAELAAAVEPKLSPAQATAWRELGPYGQRQPLGEAIVHFALRILTLQGVLCFAPRTANKAPFVLVDEWLGGPLPPAEATQARIELLRRYLRCYGPATPAEFASWLGVRVGDVAGWWEPAAAELTAVSFAGRRTWLLSESLAGLALASEVVGVRLLPPGDPYTQQRDRDTIVDRALQAQLWKPIGAPGALLADGEIVGSWRARKSGRTLTVSVEPFAPLKPAWQDELQDEAARLATLRGADRVQLT